MSINKTNLDFDWETYYDTYKKKITNDLEINIKNRDIALHHWNYFGKNNNLQYFTLNKQNAASSLDQDGTDPNYDMFDWKQYVKNYKDLEKDITSKDLAWDHWCKHGKHENRTYKAINTEISIKENNKNSKEYDDFDWKTYIFLYPDLKYLKNKTDAWNHWINHGKQEGRECTQISNKCDDEYDDFDWKRYITKYSDLSLITSKKEAWKHWISHGKTELRVFFSISNPSIVDMDACCNMINKNHWKYYEILICDTYYTIQGDDENDNGNSDGIDNFDKIKNEIYKEIEDEIVKAKTQLITMDKFKQKIIDIENMNYSNFIQLQKKTFDIRDNWCFIYITPPQVSNENTNIKKNVLQTRDENMSNNNFIKCNYDLNEKIDYDVILKNTLHVKKLYKNQVKKFMEIYNIDDEKNVFSDPKIEFRFFCFKYIDFMRNCFIAPKIKLFQPKEAVFIEFRDSFPHIEFIVRNAIMKLGSEWSFTIICGNSNYQSLISICNDITENIKVVKTEYNNMTISQYSDFLKTVDFWELIHGDKVLIFQEDSFIFNHNIDDFIEYDYIGAPWCDEVLPINVGNGGLSLRSKQIMIDVIKHLEKENVDENEELSEDVFFSKHMQRLRIGKVANCNVSSKFSSELIYNPDSFGGHQFWLSDELWRERMYESLHKYIVKPTEKKDKKVLH